VVSNALSAAFHRLLHRCRRPPRRAGRRAGSTPRPDHDGGHILAATPRARREQAHPARPAAAGVSGSVGTVGDAYDNALAESVIGLFKTELIKPRGPWRTAEQVEIATLEYVDWFNHRRLYEACGDIPPAELETVYYRQNAALAEAGQTTT
jgi:transposase InsO family protein